MINKTTFHAEHIKWKRISDGGKKTYVWEFHFLGSNVLFFLFAKY